MKEPQLNFLDSYKQVLLNFMSLEQIKKARDLSANEIASRYIEPNIKKIDELTGQENNILFWAYAVLNESNKLKG
jgi:hypothetical protein